MYLTDGNMYIEIKKKKNHHRSLCTLNIPQKQKKISAIEKSLNCNILVYKIQIYLTRIKTTVYRREKT